MQIRGLMVSILMVLSSAAAWAQTSTTIRTAIRPADLPTLANIVAQVRFEGTEPSKFRNKTVLEKNILASLVEETPKFLTELSPSAVEHTLNTQDGIFILQKTDSLLTLAAQTLAEKASALLQLKDPKSRGIAMGQISQIRMIEKKRDDLAEQVAKRSYANNFNAYFDYFIQAHFRRAEGLNQAQPFPRHVKDQLFGRKNPYQAAFKALKKMTLEVLASNDTGPVQNIRMLKISGTAELLPHFKPTLQAWEVEAYYFRRSQNRLPSSAPASPAKKQAAAQG